MNKFIAIDVETANSDMSSICQIGIAWFEGANIIKEWKSYVDPEDYFDPKNINVHGIDKDTISRSPTFRDLSKEVFDYMHQQLVVSHTHFDRIALVQTYNKYQLTQPVCDWLDSSRVVRNTWEEFKDKGYGLKNVCNFIGYEYEAHDALEDAKAAGKVLLAASSKNNIDIVTLANNIKNESNSGASSSRFSKPVKRMGNPYGSLYGERIVFTGSLEISRNDAADMAAMAGCRVDQGVTKKTTLLVVGDQDISHLAGHDKSSKHRKAEELISKGLPIKILKESDFKKIVELDN